MTSRPALFRRLLAGRSGSAAVEFALVLPFMVLLCFAFVGAGRLFWNYHIAVSAVRDAARYAARLPMDCAGFTGTSAAQNLTNTQNLTRTGTVDASGTPLIATWTSNATVTVSFSCVANSGAYLGRYEDMTGVPRVQVSATPPYIESFGPLTGVTLTSFTVSAQEAWTE